MGTGPVSDSFTTFRDPILIVGCLVYLYYMERYLFLLQLYMPCFIDTNRRPALSWMEAEKEGVEEEGLRDWEKRLWPDVK